MDTRPEQMAKIKKALQSRFPNAKIVTNADCNPATPMAVRLEWGNGRIVKAVRANSANSTADDFLAKALGILVPFAQEAVPTKYH